MVIGGEKLLKINVDKLFFSCFYQDRWFVNLEGIIKP
jgi:hypothetical protein